MSIVVLVLMIGALYAFMIVPQQRRMKAHQALLRSLEEGDMVVTSSGIHGAIAEVEDDIVWLEVAPEVELKVSRTSITEKLTDDDDDDDDGGDDDEDEEEADDETMAEADDET